MLREHKSRQIAEFRRYEGLKLDIRSIASFRRLSKDNQKLLLNKTAKSYIKRLLTKLQSLTVTIRHIKAHAL